MWPWKQTKRTSGGWRSAQDGSNGQQVTALHTRRAVHSADPTQPPGPGWAGPTGLEWQCWKPLLGLLSSLCKVSLFLVLHVQCALVIYYFTCKVTLLFTAFIMQCAFVIYYFIYKVTLLFTAFIMQCALVIYYFTYKVFLLVTALYAMCPCHLLRYIQSVLIVHCFNILCKVGGAGPASRVVPGSPSAWPDAGIAYIIEHWNVRTLCTHI